MIKKTFPFYLLNYCSLLVCINIFAQKEIYKSDFPILDFQSASLSESIAISGNTILFNTENYFIYAIDTDSLKTIWKTYVGTKSNSAPYVYKNSFLVKNLENGTTRTAQYNLATGEKIKALAFESINSKPYFVNNIMYCTVLADGGKLIAYNLEENKIIWEKNIGFGVDFQPVYSADKIIANAEEDNWFEIDYNGNFLYVKSKKHTFIDTTDFLVNKYKFLTHDGKEISKDFLRKNKISIEHYQTKPNHTNTFILSENQLLILGNHKKKVLQLDLETMFPIDNFDYSIYNSILTINPERIWFCYQNQLIHYDFKNNKLLRKVDLTKWNPHQVLLENRTIWLISKNDGQLYGLDFEPDQKKAYEIEARAKQNICTEPDPKMIEAAKAVREKFKTRNN